MTANFVQSAGLWTGKVCEISAVGTVTHKDLETCKQLLLGKFNAWVNSQVSAAPPSSGINVGLVAKGFYG